jgi:hypothetical protein
MIIEFIPTKMHDARGSIDGSLEYIYEISNHGDGKTAATVQHIGSSASLCAPNPFHSFLNDSKARKVIVKADLQYLKDEFSAIESKNRGVKKPYLHIVFSLREGEQLTNSQWHALISEFVEKMGYTDHHWCASHHLNTKQDHAHLLLSCIENSPPHKKMKDSNNFEKSALIRNELEAKYSLDHDNNPFINDRCLKVNNAKAKSKIQEVRGTIDRVLSAIDGQSITLPDFVEKMINKGIGCHVQLSQGEVKGLSFSLGKDTFKASKLGKGYRFSDLEKEGVFYNKEKHWDAIEQSNSLEVKITKLIRNGFKPATINQSEPNQHYMLIPNKEVKKYPMEKRLHRYQIFQLWIPVSTKGKTKSEIESQMLQMKMIRLLLKAYFQWLYTRNKMKHEQTGVKFKNPNYGISKGVLLKAEQVNSIVKQPDNHDVLKRHNSLLISKQTFLKLKRNSKKLNFNPPPAVEISLF